MEKKLIIIALNIVCKIYSQQNLVLNGSFEDSVNCPFTSGQINFSKYWFDPTAASSDYFNGCSISNFCSTPTNFFGYQTPKTGNAYAGFVNYRGANDNFREYISTSLSNFLQIGKLYCVEFYISLSDSCQFACNNIGVAFSADTLKGSIYQPISTTTLNVIEVQNEKSNWVKVQFEYLANGNEKFMTIGNFYDYAQTQTVITSTNSSSFYNYSYYYIDDVSVTECSDVIETTKELDEIPECFTPNGDGKNDKFEVNIKETWIGSIYNRWGNKVANLSNEKNSWDGKYKEGDCPFGTYYFYIELINSKIIKKGYVQLIK